MLGISSHYTRRRERCGRLTQTYAAGALGNDRPLTIVSEYWYAAELRLNLLTKRTDPRHGVQTVRVTELMRDEPDGNPVATVVPIEVSFRIK